LKKNLKITLQKRKQHVEGKYFWESCCGIKISRTFADILTLPAMAGQHSGNEQKTKTLEASDPKKS